MTRIKKIIDVKEEKPKIKCQGKCGRELSEINFYQSKSPFFPNGKVNICKKCLKEMVDLKEINTVYSVMQMLDIPFYYDIWEKCLESNNPLGGYIRQANSGINQFSGARWKDSIFDSKGSNIEKDYEKSKSKNKISEEELDKLKDKFGYGYPDEEYYLYEKKYNELRPSFLLPTTMHEECLREYCIDKVKESLAKAKGDFKEAKEWSTMAKEQASSGKLNPSQMSKSDLTGGLDTFGQMSRMVEQSELGELMRVLPSFMEKPKDRVDITLWLYINYIRDLLGKEECTYEEVWDFYNIRVSEYEKKMIDKNMDEFIKENTGEE